MSGSKLSLVGEGLTLISGANVSLSCEGLSLDTDGLTLFDDGLSLTGTSTSDYVGPGDIVSGATAFYGLQAYNAAAALPGTTKAVNVRRASDNATQDIFILPDGNLDVATAAAFAGVDAMGSATTTGSSTTIAITGASSTPHVGSTLTGAGISADCYVISVGSFIAGAGTIVVSVAQNIAVAEPVIFTWGLYVTEWYDQSGNGNSVVQVTAGNQPQLLARGLGNGPCVSFQKSANQGLSGALSLAQPFSLGVVEEFIGSDIADHIDFYFGDAFTDFNGFGQNTILVDAGSPIVSDDIDAGLLHYVISVFDGASSSLTVDQSAINGDLGTGNISRIDIGYAGFAPFNGYISVGVIYPLALSPTQVSFLSTNLMAYWGTP